MHYQGFHVTVFEKIRQFQRLGDSLGLGENALKLLRRWGLHDQLIKIGNRSPDMNIRRWSDGKILATQPLMDMAGYIGHRGDYHQAFLDRVAELGININMAHNVSASLLPQRRYVTNAFKVVSFNEDKPSITLEDGREFEADIIIGADGEYTELTVYGN